jgi:hypothetical protein
VLVRYFKLKDAYRDPPKALTLSSDKSTLNGTWHRCPKLEDR